MRTNEGLQRIWIVAAREFRERARTKAFQLGTLAAVLVVLIVGASRVYLGAHWLTDVLAGYALGASWVAIVATVLLITSRDTSKATLMQERGPGTDAATSEQAQGRPAGPGRKGASHRRDVPLASTTARAYVPAGSGRPSSGLVSCGGAYA